MSKEKILKLFRNVLTRIASILFNLKSFFIEKLLRHRPNYDAKDICETNRIKQQDPSKFNSKHYEKIKGCGQRVKRNSYGEPIAKIDVGEWNTWKNNEGVKILLEGANCRKYILLGIDLSRAHLIGVNLRNANLRSANLVKADLSEANLRETDFKDAKLDNTVLRGANLQGAKLASAKGLVAGQLGGTDVSGAELPKEMQDFAGALGHVTEASKIARHLFITIALACLYCLITIATTTDVHLITNSATSSLPIIGAPVPTIPFYVVSSLLLLGLYIYFHIYLQRLWESIADLPAILPDGRRICDKVYPWLLNGLVYKFNPLLQDKPRQMAKLQIILVVLLAWGLVPIVELWFWARYLPSHDWSVTGIHILLLTITFWICCRTYQIAAATLKGKITSSQTKSIRQKACKYFKLLIYFSVIGLIFFMISLGAITFEPSQSVRKSLLNTNYSPFIEISNEDVSIKPSNWTGSDEQIELVKGAKLQGKNLIYANANSAFLVKADLREAKLRKSILCNADLRNARLCYADLRQADLSFANLAGADLSWADLAGANLIRANLTDAKFIGANLTGAKLNEANLTNANLKTANLTLASLVLTNLSHANLISANLLGSNLLSANLTEADLAAANFSQAYLWGTNLQNIQNWKKHTRWKLANVYGLVNEPNGFTEWVIEKGGISTSYDAEWIEMLKKEGIKVWVPNSPRSAEMDDRKMLFKKYGK